MRTEWTGVFGGIHLRLRAREDGILQVTRDLSGQFRENEYSPVTECPEGAWIRRTEAGSEVFALPGLCVRVNRGTGALSFEDGSGKLLLRECPDCPADLQLAEIRRSVFSEETRITEKTGADGARSSADPAATETDRTGVRGRQYFCFQGNEALYGLGSHEEGIGNLRGHMRLLYQHNLKAVVPVLVSTAGWGILFDMGCGMAFHDDEEGSFMEIDCADSLDWYFVCGNGTWESLMEKLRGLTGPAPMLPRYALGFIQSKERYVNAQELEDTVAEYRRRKIPLDVIVQDWQTWPEGQWGLKQYDRSRYPEGFADRLHAMNARVMLSIWPHMQGDRNSNRDEMIREGCMLGNRSTYNAFSPKGRAIYGRQIREGLMTEKIDAWWCDCTEPFEADWQGSERLPDEERMRVNTGEARKYLDPASVSLYSLLHSQGIWEEMRRDPGSPRVLNLTRSSWAGQHRYAAVTWSGDVCATWETMQHHVPEGLNFMASGEPFWNCDVGGFFTNCREPWFWRGEFPRGTEDPGYRELFVRWLQYACFLTMMRAHGTDTPREIWQFGDEGDRYYEAIAACIRMRYRLLAYQYSLMAETREKGIPAVRVPALVFPEDPRLRETDHEMMLGGGILVCPVTRPVETLPGGEKIADPDENTEVYLPAGFRWYEADGDGVYDGGQAVTVRTPLEKVPVFVREGTILPLSPVRQYTDEETAEPTEIIIFPGTDGAFAFYDDDGISYDYEHGEYQRIPMRWNDREWALTLGAQEGRLRREQRFAVRLRGGKETREITYTGEEMTVRF